MSQVPFSTLSFTETLRAGGLSERQAKSVTEAVAAAMANLVSKTDLELTEQRLTLKLGGIMAFGVGLIATIVKLG